MGPKIQKSLLILWESPSIPLTFQSLHVYNSPMQCQSPKETPTKYFKTIQRKQLPCSPASSTLLHLSWWHWDLHCVSHYTLLFSQPHPQMFIIMSHLSGQSKYSFFSFITTRVQQLENITTTLEPLLSLPWLHCLFYNKTMHFSLWFGKYHFKYSKSGKDLHFLLLMVYPFI